MFDWKSETSLGSIDILKDSQKVEFDRPGERSPE